MGVNLNNSEDRKNLTNKEKIMLVKNGSMSAIKIELTLSAEITDNNKALLHFSDDSGELFSTWYYPPREDNKAHRGNKSSYSMLMNKAFKTLLKEHNPSNEEIGVMTKLFMYADWGTGLLTKRKKPLKLDDMIKIIGNSKPTVLKITKSLKDKYILDYRDNGYYLSRTFIKKGGASNGN